MHKKSPNGICVIFQIGTENILRKVEKRCCIFIQAKEEEAERERLAREEEAKKQAEALRLQQEKAAAEVAAKEQERINFLRLRVQHNYFAKTLVEHGMPESEVFEIMGDHALMMSRIDRVRQFFP